MTSVLKQQVSGVAAELRGIATELFGGELPIRLRAWDGSECGPLGPPTVVLRSPRALRRLLWHPSELGLAQAYVSGELDVDGDLADGLRLVWAAARERGLSCSTGIGWRQLAVLAPAALVAARRAGALGAPLPPPKSQARLRGRVHSGRRDRAAVAHHYDLSNEFYALLLDSRMAYSSAYWSSDAADYTLEQAQADKLDLVCRKLQLQPGQRLLDVGCGWGSLSIHAALNYGVQVTGITLSRQQAAFGVARVRELGLSQAVRIRLLDYRELDAVAEGFDAVASLEMGEHVGEQNYPAYAATLHRMVRPGGRVLVQQMSRGSVAPGGGAFIEAFIAADMQMRPVGQTALYLERAGLEVREVQAMREHYVRTVRAWHENFERRWDDAVALVGEEVARVWRLYLLGGGLAFEEGRMGVDQILSVRPRATGGRCGPSVRAS